MNSIPQWMKKTEPWTKFIPAIKKAPESLGISSKFLYTVGAITIYLIGLQVPLYGIQAAIDMRQQYWLQNIFNSNHGTIFELAFSPMYTTQFIMQMLVTTNILKLNRESKYQVDIYQRIQTLFGVILTFLQASLNVLSGSYGQLSIIGPVNGLLIVIQLTVGSVIMQLLDDMLDQGYGISHGLNLFTTARTCYEVFWNTFSFVKVEVGTSIQYQGAIPAAIHLLITREDKVQAIKEAFFRRQYYNLFNLICTIITFCVVIKLQGYKKTIAIQHIQGGAATEQQLPIKLLYLGGQSLQILQQMIQTYYNLVQNLYRRTGKNIFTMILGTFQENEQRPGQLYVTGGLVLLLLPINNLRDLVFSPIRILNGVVSQQMLSISQESVEAKTQELKRQKFTIKGFRQDSIQKELQKYIPVAAVTGGVILGALSIAGDLFGIIGSGSGILTAVTNILKIYEDISKELVDFF